MPANNNRINNINIVEAAFLLYVLSHYFNEIESILTDNINVEGAALLLYFATTTILFGHYFNSLLTETVENPVRTLAIIPVIPERNIYNVFQRYLEDRLDSSQHPNIINDLIREYRYQYLINEIRRTNNILISHQIMMFIILQLQALEASHIASPELVLTSTNQDKLDELDIPKEFIPTEFICPVKQGVIDKAVYDPNFPQRYDEAHLARWLNNKNENPITRAYLIFSQLKQDTFFQYKIDLYVKTMEKQGEKLLALPKAEALAELEKILAAIHQKAIKAFSIIPYTGTQHSILFASNQAGAREPSLHPDSNSQHDPNCHPEHCEESLASLNQLNFSLNTR